MPAIIALVTTLNFKKSVVVNVSFIIYLHMLIPTQSQDARDLLRQTLQ